MNQTQVVDQLAEQVAKVRRRARPWRSIFALLLALFAMIGSVLARERSRDLDDKLPLQLVAAGCAAAFFVFGFAATLGLSGRARDILLPRVGNAHATMVRLLIVLVGALATLVLTLQLFDLPVGQLVLGGALTGVLVGIAAQQTLANLFAGIILLLSKPFVVGDDVRLWSGPLGGQFDGTVLEIGLTYVRLEAANGEFRLPNAQVLSSAVGPRDTNAPATATATATGSVAATAQAVPAEGGSAQDPAEPGPIQTAPVAAQTVHTEGESGPR
ncbi:MAG TPA: mechanosensitive ion channel domain-containing protein [Actinoallomurus sp.]|nr:mechanosensitive ion channel domain-containing protein [Actinoallomurus sp.]